MKKALLLSLLLVLGLASATMQAQSCTVLSSSINQNFDGMAHGSRPPCWVAHNPVNAYTFSGVYNGDNRYWLLYNSGGAPANNISPVPFLLVMQRCTMRGPLSFQLRANNNMYGLNRPFEIGTMSDPNNPATFTLFQTFTHGQDTPVNLTCDLTSYTGTNQYIAFRGWLSNGNQFVIDNVVWSGPPAVVMPPKGF